MEVNCQQNCVFSDPTTFDGTPAETKQDFWAYRQSDCEIVCQVPDDPTIELVENPVMPDRGFYVDKTFSYGDALMMWFFTLFLIFVISTAVFNFLWKR